MSNESKPIDIADFQKAVEELPDDTLVSIKNQIETSISKLKSTNDQLKEEVTLSKSKEDIDLYNEVIIENTEVIRNQQIRTEFVDTELKKRGFTVLQSKSKKEEIEEDETEISTENGVYL